MNIVMMTNTYTPHVGGVARSVQSFVDGYRRRGHRVLVVAPEFPDTPEEEQGVIRLPAIQRFNGSDFSVVLPVPGYLSASLDEFEPDVIHSHHPFLVGSTALRAAQARRCPLVFTHHTMYEQYTHYVPGDSDILKRFVIRLSTSYANLCDLVFAPSESVAGLLRRRGVRRPVEVIPTGVRREDFAAGDGARFRRAMGIPADARVVGHLGRLAPEKNLEFLAGAAARLLEADPRAWFLVVGEGPSAGEIRRILAGRGVADRLCLAGKRVQPELADAYHAMDVFAFASLSETQGMVLAEAMAAGLPVVAVDAPGVREVVRDGRNGYLLPSLDEAAFADALQGLFRHLAEDPAPWREAVARTAVDYSLERAVDRALRGYASLGETSAGERQEADDAWQASMRRIRAEWDLIKGMAQAAGAAAGAGRDEDARSR